MILNTVLLLLLYIHIVVLAACVKNMVRSYFNWLLYNSIIKKQAVVKVVVLVVLSTRVVFHDFC